MVHSKKAPSLLWLQMGPDITTFCEWYLYVSESVFMTFYEQNAGPYIEKTINDKELWDHRFEGCRAKLCLSGVLILLANFVT